MAITIETLSKGKSSLIYLLGCACLLATIISGGLYSPAYAAADDPESFSQNPVQLSACTPPNDWNQTVRLKNPQKPTKKWTFNVSEPEMEVKLVFFYYQDYDKSGCPYDCSTGECQTDETGKGETPLGNINVLDGNEGGNRGVKKVEGKLTQGTYQVVFKANGNPGSLNVGLNVKTNALPTATPQPTDTPIPTATTPTEPPPPTETEPSPTDTDIPTVTATTPAPLESPTPSATKEGPAPTETEVKRTPPATLPPPTPLPGSSTPLVLIPVTGARTAGQNQGNGWLLIPLGIGVFGLGIAFYGIATRLKQE